MNTHTHKISGVLLSIAVILSVLAMALPAMPVQAAALTGVTDTPVPAYCGVTSQHSIAFTTATALPVNARIALGFTGPDTFNVEAAAYGSKSGIDGNLTVSVSGQTINIDRSGGTESAPGAKIIVLTGIINPPTSGSYTISVITYASNGGATLDTGTSSVFTITPAATFTPIIGPIGTRITVSGTSWATAGETIDAVTVGAGTVVNPGFLNVASGGILSGYIIVPAGATTGNIVITRSTTGPVTYTNAFTVTTANATFTPSTGPVSATLTISSGAGWAVKTPADTISSVTIDGTAATNTLVVSTGGTLSGTITVPTGLTTGPKTVIITGVTSGAQNSATPYTVTTANATFTPVTGPAGAPITISSGAGWAVKTPADTISSVTVGGTAATHTLVVSTAGVLSGTITVPASLSTGVQTVVITGVTSGAHTSATTFTVTPLTATFTPNSGPAGTVISTVTGTGWVASDNISAVTVGGTAAASYSLLVDTSGNLLGSITTANNLTNGIKTIVITGTGSGAQTFSSAFTVTSTATISLRQGWNLISLPLVPASAAITDIIPSSVQAYMMAPYGQLVDCTYLTGAAAAPTWRWWTPDRGSYPGFSTMDDGKAYWIYVTQACSFTVTGTACGSSSPGAVAPPRAYWMYYSTSYPDGWNLLGFKSSQSSMKASDYLAGLQSSTYAPILYRYDGAWVSVALGDNLIPGAGYYIRMYANGSVLPPCN